MSITINARNIPGFPGAIHYKIAAEDYDSVQKEINRLFRQIEQIDGCAEFSNPRRVDGGYQSSGYTYVPEGQKNLGECDCCGRMGTLTRCFPFGIETSACDECRGTL